MNEKEIGEIRRRVRRDRSNMTAIYGCYVNANREIISEFKQSTGMMPENEAEKYFGLLKRTLSGAVGKNLLDMSFRTSQVADSPEHKFLMDLRSNLTDGQLREALYRKIIENVSLQDNYLILLGVDSYDVPFKSKDGEAQADASSDVYTYLLCCVCPVKQAKPGLHYDTENKEFHEGGAPYMACPPELGFLFPAFDGRATNIYNALFYTKSPKESYEAVIDALFNLPAPKPAAEQKKSFEALLTTSVGEGCSMELVQNVHQELLERIELHKESKSPEPLVIEKQTIQNVLASSGVSQEKVAKFGVEYDNVFGSEAQLHPKNIVNRRFEVKMPDVSITVTPEGRDLVETRIIDGVKYILICADENVEVNGVNIHIRKEDPAAIS